MILTLALISIFVLLIGLIFAKFNIPLLASYIFSGILAGIFSKIIIGKLNFAPGLTAFSDIGVILLMFAIGVEFPLTKVLRLKSKIIWLAVLQVLTTTLVLSSLFLAFQISLPKAIVFSVLFSFSSTVIVAKYLSEKGLIHSEEGGFSLGVLILQDLFVIPVSVFLPFFLQKEAQGLVLVGNIALVLTKSVLIFGFIILIVNKIMPYIFKKVSAVYKEDLLLLTVISLSLLMSGFAAALGFPLAVGAFIAGMTVSLSTEKYAIFSEIKPLRDIFSILFFIFLGFSLDVEFIFKDILKIILFAVVVIVVKTAVLYLLSLKFSIHPKNAFKTSVNLSEVSEFAFILSAIYYKSSLLSVDDYRLILSVTLLTIVISPFLFKEEAWFLKKFKSVFEIKENKAYVFAKNLSLENHIILCGYGRIGQRIVKNLLLHGIPFVIIDDNKNEVEVLQGRGLNAIYGDATEVEILGFAGITRAKAIVIAVPDRFSQEAIISHSSRLNPRIIIYGRAHENEDKQYLYALGARYVLYPEFEGAMAMTKRILKLFKIDDFAVNQTLRQNFEDEKII